MIICIIQLFLSLQVFVFESCPFSKYMSAVSLVFHTIIVRIELSSLGTLSNGTYGAKEGVGMNNPYAIAVTEASNL